MEEGTPVLETFTQSVNEGPSQPLMRKLMSMMLSADAPREDPDISGFFLVDTAPVVASSRPGSSGPVEDIGQASSSAGCLVEDMEAAVQSGFRFTGAGDADDSPSPRAENYFTETSIPADLAEKIPMDFLHAVNNTLDTKVFPTQKTHHHGRRRAGRRPGVFRNREEPLASSSLSASAFGASYGQEMILRRLDRLEEICLRTESYMHLVLGTLDRRLQLLEGEALRPSSSSTQDSGCSPRFPGAAGLSGFTNEAETFVSPEMFSLQSPHPTRSLIPGALLQVPEEKPGDDSGICLSPIESLPSPVLIIASSITTVAPPEAPEHPFTSPASAVNEELQQEAHPVVVGEEVEVVTTRDEGSGELQTQVSAVAAFSLADAEAPEQQDPLFCEPVVGWGNEGFPYLRPSYRVPSSSEEIRLRETTVLTWDAAAGFLSPESTMSSEDDRRTSNSSEDAFSIDNFDEKFDTPPLQHHHHEQFQRQEEGMLEEISSILKNICSDLELLRSPQQQQLDQPGVGRVSCMHCSGRDSEMAITSGEAEDIFSVLEGVFQRLPQPEDVLVNITPREAKPAPAPDDDETVHYSRVPESEEAASSTRSERSFDIFPQEAGTSSERISLSVVQEDKPELFATQDTLVKIDVPREAASGEFATLHVALAPKEVKKKLDASSEQIASAIVQDVCVSVESTSLEPLVLENEYYGPELPPAGEQPQEAVVVLEEKVQLTGEISADYTLKVVPDGGAPSSSVVVFPEASPAEKMINNDTISSVVHELCFSVDVPTAGAPQAAPQTELPLQVAIVLTGDSRTGGSGAEVVSAQGLTVRPLIQDMPVDESGEGGSEEEAEPPRKDVASIILSLEALQRATSCSRPGCSRTEPCSDPSCLLVSDRKEVGQEEVTSVHQDVCISLEVPASPESSNEGIHVGLSVRTVPSVPGESCNQLISCVELSDDQEMGKAPLTEIPSSIARVEQPSDEEEEELVPLRPEPLGIVPLEAVESIVAPPPSPVEAEPETHKYLFKEEGEAATNKTPESVAAPETETYLFKEEEEEVVMRKPPETAPETYLAETTTEAESYLFKEDEEMMRKSPETAPETETYLFREDEEEVTRKPEASPETYLFKEEEEESTRKALEAEAVPETYLFKEEEEETTRKAQESEDAPETYEYLFKEEPKKQAEEWVIESVFLPKDNLQQVEAKVPQPVVRGMTPMDLVRGSLHFDGKACLLAVSTDDLWTADEMCQAPSSASTLEKQKAPFKLVDLSVKGAGAGAGTGSNVPSWLGEVLGDRVKPPPGAPGEKNMVFGFRKQRVEPEQKQQQQQSQQQSPLGFRPAAGITPVFGFRNLSGKQPVKPAAQVEPMFGFNNAKKPPLPPKPKIFVNVPVATEEECDSSLSVVSRSPASQSRNKLANNDQPPPVRVPDSPGAKNTIAVAAAAATLTTTTTITTTTTSLVVTEIEQEQRDLGTCGVEAGAIAAVEAGVNGGDEQTGAGLGGVVRAPKTPLDLIDAGGVSEEESAGDWSSELTVLPLDPSAVAAAMTAVSHDETFFDALQCSGTSGFRRSSSSLESEGRRTSKTRGCWPSGVKHQRRPFSRPCCSVGIWK